MGPFLDFATGLVVAARSRTGTAATPVKKFEKKKNYLGPDFVARVDIRLHVALLRAPDLLVCAVCVVLLLVCSHISTPFPRARMGVSVDPLAACMISWDSWRSTNTPFF